MNILAAYADRAEAGRCLAERLAVRRLRNPVVYALPGGGVPVACEVARALFAPLELILVRRLGAPGSPEVAVGAVAEGLDGAVVNLDIYEMSGADEAYVEQAATEARAEIARRRKVYLDGRPALDAKARTAIIVDDGLMTGATARAAVRAIRRRGADRVIVAIPVAPRAAVVELREYADEVLCPLQPYVFPEIGAFYADFHTLTDAEVIAGLDAAAVEDLRP